MMNPENMKKHFHIEKNDPYDVLNYTGPKPQTLKTAWEITFAKWQLAEKYSRETGRYLEGMGGGTCGLCLFCPIGRYSEPLCLECPVGKYTGKGGCRGTPFVRYFWKSDEFDAADPALDELKFLNEVYKANRKEET